MNSPPAKAGGFPLRLKAGSVRHTADYTTSKLSSALTPKQRSEKTGGKRVQKNLTIDESDAKRLAQLSKREKISQARLLGLALDAYEHCYGAIDNQDIKP